MNVSSKLRDAATTVLLGAGAAVIIGSAALGQNTGYTFRNISVGYGTDPITKEIDTSSAALVYDLGWQSLEFPGTRLCTFRVRDAAGAIIGERTGNFTALEPQKGAGTHMPTSGSPSSADVSCGDARVDDPGGTFRFSDISVAHVQTLSGDLDPKRVALSFSAEWAGTGYPATQQCNVTVYGQSGSALLTNDFTFTSSSDRIPAATKHLVYSSDLPEPPASADLDCRPFTG